MRSLLKQTLTTFGIVIVANALMVLFHVIATRILSVEDYGNLSTVMAYTLILFVSANGFSTDVTRKVAKLGKKGKEIMGAYFKKAIDNGMKIVGLTIGFASLAYFLGQREVSIGFMIGSLFAPLIYIFGCLKGYFQGREDRKELAKLMVLSNLTTVMSLVILSKIAGWYGAVASLWAGALAMDLYYRDIFKTKEREVKLKFGKIAIVNVLLILAANLDIFLVRFFLGPEATGYYNAAALMAKFLFLGTDGLVMTLLPKASKITLREKEKVGELLFISISFLVIGLTIFTLFPNFLMSLFFPPNYLVAVPLFIILTISMFSLGMITVIFNIFWSQHMEEKTMRIMTIALLSQATLLSIFIPILGSKGAALSSATTFSITAITSLYLLGKESRKLQMQNC